MNINNEISTDVIMREFESSFIEAMDEIKSYSPQDKRQRLFQNNAEKNLDFQFMSYGKHYFEQKIKLFVVGRASGEYEEDGWVVVSHTGDTTEYDMERLKASVRSELDGHAEWFANSSSQFSKLIRNTAHALIPEGIDEDNLQEYIVLTNLYKFIPHCGSKNPSAPLCKAQKNIAPAMLKKQLEFFKPTHILLITGESWTKIDKNDENKIFEAILKEYKATYAAKYAIVERPECKSDDYKQEKIYDIINQRFGTDIHIKL